MKKALLAINLAVLLWGFTGILGRLIEIGEAWLVWYRMLFSCITVWLLNIKLKEIERVPLKHLLGISATGALQGLHWIFFFGSVHYANVSVALVCLSSAALFTSLAEPLLTRRRLRWEEVLLGLMGMAGIYLIFHFDTAFEKGILFGVLAAIPVSVTPVLNKRFLQRYHTSTVTAWNMTGGWLFLCMITPVYNYFFPPQRVIPTLTETGWLVILAAVCTVYTWRIALTALKKVSAFTLMLMLNLEPVYGILMAFAIFGEHRELSSYFYLGFAVIFLSVAIHINHLFRKKKQAV